MKSKKCVILDGTKIKTIEDFHLQIKQVLELPDYYGMNLDALWDCLTSWIDDDLALVWEHYETSKYNIGEYANKAMELFINFENQSTGFKILPR